MLGVGAKEKTYIDDVFSTQVYTGNSSARSINTGIDMTKGGLVWSKRRDGNYWGPIIDTVRGKIKILNPANNGAEGDYANTSGNEGITSFNSNGYSLGADGSSQVLNHNNNTYASWSFRKAPGFFDVVTYDGNAQDRTISHSLGSVPGCIIIKRLDDGGGNPTNWVVYHRSTGNEAYLKLDTDDDPNTALPIWQSTTPTSTSFSIKGTYSLVNADGGEYVAYVFAGGESTAATARSVYFDGTSSNVTASDDDLELGTNNYTIECWVKGEDLTQDRFIFGFRPSTSGSMAEYGFDLYVTSNGNVYGRRNSDASPTPMFVDNAARDLKIYENTWNHVAVVRSATNNMRLYINGKKSGSTYTNHGDDRATSIKIGQKSNTGGDFKGYISNFRITKGQALYTSDFFPTQEPLTTTSQGATASNVVLLCCNNSSVTGATVTPGSSSLSSSGTVAAKTDSAFDDPAGFKFGENGEQGIIKCGSYKTDSNEDATVTLGWEPQWVMTKRTDANGDWRIYDSMRGIANAEDVAANSGASMILEPNEHSAEATSSKIGFTSTGFYADQDGGSRTYVYVALRRPDGYVGKPPELGTDVFAMDTGASSSTIPNFDSGFPVDMGLLRKPDETWGWRHGARLTQGQWLDMENTNDEGDWSKMMFDSNQGYFWHSSYGTDTQAWMWKRHAGFTTVTYKGNGSAGRGIHHDLSKIPEMIWVKRRDSGGHWRVYHKGLNGGTNPEQYRMLLDSNDKEELGSTFWNDTAPNSNVFFVGSNNDVNSGFPGNYIAMLFASVSGISAVGSYSGSSSDQTITTGFQPRFVLIKSRSSGSRHWIVLDTTRGWGSGNDNWLALNDTAHQSSYDFGAPTSTGFTVTGASGQVSGSGNEFIYYAHA